MVEFQNPTWPGKLLDDAERNHEHPVDTSTAIIFPTEKGIKKFELYKERK